MDPESQRALLVVLAVGFAVIGIGTLILFFIFRAFGGAKAGGTTHKALMVALIAFIFLCCLGLVILARSGN
jgi:hypothetical protein